jgi:hypothetical protein
MASARALTRRNGGCYARERMADESFLGRVFDAYQNMTQIAACIRELGRQRGLARPRVLELSRRDTGLAEYVPDVALTRFATHANEEPSLPVPVALPFADRAFDCCLVTDVYEHVAAERRPELLAEMLRVTDGLVIVAAPHADPVVSRFDRVVFDFIWGKYGERFGPLQQHVDFGLEPIERTVASLRALGADEVVVLPGNYVYRWIHMILIYFDLQHRNPLGALFEPFNRVYNQYLSPYDYREPCYRYLVAIPTRPDVDVHVLEAALRKPPEPPGIAAETDHVLTETFRAIDATAADELRRAGQELARLVANNAEKDRTIARLEAELRLEGARWSVRAHARRLARRVFKTRA